MRGHAVARCLAFVVSLTLLAPLSGADAAPKPRKEAAPAKKPPVRDVAASRLAPGAAFETLAGLPFGQDLDALMAFERKRVEGVYRPLIRATRDIGERDRLQKEAERKVTEFSRSHVEFSGQASGYDVSILSGEFRHGMGHAMRAREDGDARCYFFLANGKLWKLLRQLPADSLRFADLVTRLRGIYGRPAHTETRTVADGDTLVEVPERVVWEDGALTVVATDLSALYQAYVVKWAVTEVEEAVATVKPRERPDARAQFRTDEVLRDISTPAEDTSVSDIVDGLLEGGAAPTEPRPSQPAP